MADENSQTEYSQTDVTSGLNESLGNGFKITGKVMKKSLVHTEQKITKAEKKNEHLKENGFKYAMNDNVDKHIGQRKTTSLDANNQKRLNELKSIQKKRKLTGTEATELRGLEREKAKAKAGAKAQRNQQAAVAAKGKLPEYDVKKDIFSGEKKLELSDTAKKRQRLQVLREQKAAGFLTPSQSKELKNLEKTVGKADKKNENQKNRNKNSAVKALGKQAEAFTDSVIKGDGENLGTEAFLNAKGVVKGTYDFLTGTTQGIKDGVALHKTKKEVKARKKALRKEKQQFKAEVDYLYKDFLENYDKAEALKPEKDRKELTNRQKAAQKRQIKKKYAAELREKQGIGGGSKKAKERLKEKIAKKKKEAEEKIKKAVFKYLAAALIVFAAFSVVILICAIGGTTAVSAEATYSTERTDIEQSEDYINQKEIELENKINSIETDYPDYDEYNYQIDEIGHNAYDLSNLLAAQHQEDWYVFDGSESDLDSIFDEMYELSTVSRNETRSTTGTCSCTNCDASCSCRAADGTCHCTDTIYYTVTILDVTLKRKELTDIAAESLDTKQKEFYDLYRDNGGLMQIFNSPLEIDWLNAIGRNYGSSRNPSTDAIEDHKGIDINVDAGMDVYSSVFKGTVEEAGTDSAFGNYVSIKKDSGEVIKFAHLSSIYVAVGDEVDIKTVIGKTGKTGSECYGKNQLHIETIDKDGSYINPVFAIESRFGTLKEHLDTGEESFPGSYFGSSTGGDTREDMNLPETYPDGDVEDLISFAEQFLGDPYVFGGSTPYQESVPKSGFDCSGFVSYCVRESGFYPSMQRKTAQGIYDNYCTPISAEEAQAGDLIFFQGTYNTGDSRVITHIGIYCGNGKMLHCGKPIQYTNTKTKYWTEHFYGYGRVGR